MSQQRRHPQVVNLDEVESRTQSTGARFGGTSKGLTAPTGAKGIGCSYYEIDPGRAAFPFHFHCANEESLFVLEGEGTMRIGKVTVSVRAGDYVTFPIGPDYAHQLKNTGSAKLKYLCFSTMSTAEVVGYPDSKKIGAAAAPSYEVAMRGGHWLRFIGFQSSTAGYFDGEDVG